MSSSFNNQLILLTRAISLAVTALILYWAIHFRGGLALSSEIKLQIFNVHPVLTVIGLIFLNCEAILAYKTISGTKNFKKGVHLAIQGVALCVSAVGIWAVYKFHLLKGIDDFYTLHSWLGLACFFSFALQWIVGFTSFWYPGASMNKRAEILFWHVFFGLYIFALAIATSVTGILEKATFMQHHNMISHYSFEALYLNLLGILMVALGGLVVFVIISLNGRNNGYQLVR